MGALLVSPLITVTMACVGERIVVLGAVMVRWQWDWR